MRATFTIIDPAVDPSFRPQHPAAEAYEEFRQRLERSIRMPVSLIRPPSDQQLRTELGVRLAVAARRVNDDVARQLAAFFEPPVSVFPPSIEVEKTDTPYLSPAEREFLEGAHAGRH